MAGCQGEGTSLLHAPARRPACRAHCCSTSTRGWAAGRCSCSRRSTDRAQYRLLVEEGEELRAGSKHAGLVLAVPRCLIKRLMLSCSPTP